MYCLVEKVEPFVVVVERDSRLGDVDLQAFEGGYGFRKGEYGSEKLPTIECEGHGSDALPVGLNVVFESEQPSERLVVLIRVNVWTGGYGDVKRPNVSTPFEAYIRPVSRPQTGFMIMLVEDERPKIRLLK